MKRDELILLLDAYRDGDLGEADAARLADLVRAEGEESAWIMAEIRTAGLVAQALQPIDADAFVRGFFERLRAEDSQDEFVQRFEARRAAAPVVMPNRSQGRRSLVRWLACIAASLLLVVGAVIWLQSRPAVAQEIARLEEVQGEVYVVGGAVRQLAKVGQRLLPGQGLQVVGEDSLAVVVYPDATRMELGGGTAYPEPDRMVLEDDGFVFAEVARTGPPMILSTRHADVAVQNGRVNLASAAQATHVAVEEGDAVQLLRKSDGKSFEVRTGFAALVASEEAFTPERLAPRLTAARQTLRGHTNYVTSVAFSGDGKTLASGGFDRLVRVWDVAAGRERLTLHGHGQRIRCLAFAPDDRCMASGSLDRSARIWDLGTGQERLPLSGHSDDVLVVAFSPDGALLATGTEDGMLRVSDVSTGLAKFHLLASRKRGRGPVRALAFAADGLSLTTVSSDGLVKTWEMTTGQPRSIVSLQSPETHGLLCLALSPDGQLIASGGKDGTVTLWDARSGQERVLLYGHRGKMMCVAFSPDGRQLASGSRDATAKIWSVAQARELATLIGHQRSSGHVNAVAFSPDGKTLATGSVDKSVKLWDVPKEITP